MSSWTKGRCLRGHDINDPHNVGETIRSENGRVVDRRRYCLECKRLVQNRYRRRNDIPSINRVYFPPRTCLFCGEEYYKLPSDKSSLTVWKHRKYCTIECRNASYSKDRRIDRNGDDIPQPNDDIILAYLRGIVNYDSSKNYERLDRKNVIARE